MSAWTFPIRLAPSGAEPLFLQIARAIAEDIARGRLVPGARLPGTRTLAATLGVHRTTVVAAYQELASQGWTDARQGAATRVATALPETRPSRWSKVRSPRRGLPSRPAFAVPSAAMAPRPRRATRGTARPLGRGSRSATRPARRARPRLATGGARATASSRLRRGGARRASASAGSRGDDLVSARCSGPTG